MIYTAQRGKGLHYFKGTHIDSISISFYNVIQKPVDPKTGLHHETERSACCARFNSAFYLRIM